MSPQSRANLSDNTTFVDGFDGVSGSPCSSLSSVAEIAEAANAAFALHKIEIITSDRESLDNVCYGPHAARCAGTISLRKRSSAHLSGPQNEQPFLFSYGSAFLSGIFADIAEASDQNNESSFPSDHTEHSDNHEDGYDSYLPRNKKSRATFASPIGYCTKSYMALAGISEEFANETPSPPVVSPRPNNSSIKINPFHDQVRELQNLAFPSLPHIPVTVSSSSYSSTNLNGVVTPRDVCVDESNSEQESTAAYGWFVSTDDEVGNDDAKDMASRIYMSKLNPDLAFKAVVAPNAESHDIEVQQALAADTIDDVLGDFF